MENSITCTQNKAPATSEAGNKKENRLWLRPKTRWVTEEKGFRLLAEMPGVRKEDLEITFEDDILKISATRDLSVPKDWKAYSGREPETGFRFQAELDKSIDPEGIKARLELGILSLELPKRAEALPRKIAIEG